MTHAAVAYPPPSVVGGDDSAVSPEAGAIRRSVYAASAWGEESIALFGKARTATLSDIRAVAVEHCESDWDGEGGEPVSMLAVQHAEAFVRALPSNVPMPEVAAEPDGSISLDWIQSRTRLLSISIGISNRLAFAWLGGTDQGHAVARFDGERVPALILERIRETIGHAAVRVA
ncbi:MAG: hypothetical protein ACRD3J_12695 [Thermoanaerobaculia bacterium]